MIYLDYAATTPLDPAVAEAMAPWLTGGLFGNPASRHAPGRRAARVVERAREQVAALLDADPAGVVFTGSASEANNLALLGAARWRRAHGRGERVVCLATDHPSVLGPCAALEREGFPVDRLPVDGAGRPEPADLEAALSRPDLGVVSLLWVNNETGAVQDLAALAPRIKEAGALLHVDAVQGLVCLPLDLSRLPADLVSLSAHKLYGPQGVGALWLRRRPRVRLEALLHGGGQEQGLRPGTVAVHQVAGLGAACEQARQRRAADAQRLGGLRRRLRSGLAALGSVVDNSPPDAAPHILNLGFAGVHGDALAAGLDDLAVSFGSACSAGAGEASHVLRALGRPEALARACLRLSLGRPTTEHEVEQAVERISRQVRELRQVSPVWSDRAAGSDLESLYGSRTPLPLA